MKKKFIFSGISMILLMLSAIHSANADTTVTSCDEILFTDNPANWSFSCTPVTTYLPYTASYQLLFTQANADPYNNLPSLGFNCLVQIHVKEPVATTTGGFFIHTLFNYYDCTQSLGVTSTAAACNQLCAQYEAANIPKQLTRP